MRRVSRRGGLVARRAFLDPVPLDDHADVRCPDLHDFCLPRRPHRAHTEQVDPPVATTTATSQPSTTREPQPLTSHRRLRSSHCLRNVLQSRSMTQRSRDEMDHLRSLIIADPNEVYRIGVKSLLADLDWAAVVGEAVDEQGLLQLLESARPDLVLLDPSVAEQSDPNIQIIERVRALAPDVKVVVVADVPETHIRRAIELGADACLAKAAGSQELAAALHLVANGRHYIQAELLGSLLDGGAADGPPPSLSTQQLTILQLLARGSRNNQIAREIGMSATTVKSHLRLIYSLLSVSSRAEAAAAAVRLGMVP